MTPEERVGQLFLVTFKGTQVGPETPMYTLISKYGVGGVVLVAANNNFTGSSQDALQTARQAQALTQQLQEIEWNASQEEITLAGSNMFPTYLPLLIGLSQEGDGYPNDQILYGLTQLPNAMGIGATWNPDLATQVGQVLGKELTVLGVNLLLGPTLDVLETPEVGLTSNLGTRSFGGDPYWVGKLGQAYIRGVHEGSEGKVMVVAKHFPGHGSSDRLPEEEVATVRKTLEELQSFDLSPFFAVTGNATSSIETAEALLTSHIRYQGLQGNIRAATRPLSFDPQALSLLIDLPELSAWRVSGGLMISDDLGSLAVRRFYNLTSQDFDANRVALNAFLAGNDLLYIGDFSSITEPDSAQAAILTLDFFAQKYREDAAFAQRVDESVLRILTLKYRLYPTFDIDSVTAAGSLNQLNQSSQVSFEVARQGATLISPSQEALDETIPDPPNLNDRMVFLTDVRQAQQCSTCQPSEMVSVRALQDTVLRLYGPQAGRQISSNNLSSYSMDDLLGLLDGTRVEGDALESTLSRSNWIVFVLLNPDSTTDPYNTLSRFLNERPDLFQQKRVIVFALSAPYYLDATNISKLTAFFGLYSKSPEFIDAAAYLLFRELQPVGASPVSILGSRYNLNQALFPAPNQVIPLEVDLPAPEGPAPEITPSPTPPPEFRLGDLIPLRAGVIFDLNNNPVPDGTLVEFVFSTAGGASVTRQAATTINGMAQTTFSVSTPGALEIYATSEAARSNTLRFEIASPGGEIAPPTPTATPTPEPTATATQTPEPTPVPAPTPVVESPDAPGIGDWLIAVLVSGLMGWACYQLAVFAGQVRWGVRIGFLVASGGLLAYCYLVAGLPGSQALLQDSISKAVLISTALGSLLGLAAALVWRAFSRAEQKRSLEKEQSK